MTQSSNIIETTPHLVFLRRSLKVNGETDGFSFEPSLICESITYRKGAACGRATFRYVNTDSLPAPLPSVENLMNRYQRDYQIHVELLPRVGGDGNPIVAFEGVLMRQELVAERLNANHDREGMTLIARPMPVLDNTLEGHVITGRWINTTEQAEEGGDPSTPQYAVIESLDMPAVFNPGGLRNCDTSQDFAFNGPTTLKANAFSRKGDVDSTAEWWTPRKAILSLLAFWLYGVNTAGDGEDPSPAAPRMVCISEDLERILSGKGSIAEMDYILPETNVHGLGVLDAIEAVCKAASMSMALQPDMDDPSFRGPEDRNYRLYISFRNRGRSNYINLQTRNVIANQSSSITLQNNDVSSVRILQDSLRTYSRISARGRTAIEASFVLKPLWSPDDMAGDSDDGTPKMQLPPNQSDLDYSSRHVQGGAEFNNYEHVGRLWGIDCTGEFAPNGYIADPGNSKPTDVYAHTEADQEPGFDFVSYLALTTSPLADERADLDVSDPIVWSKRQRYPQPIRRPDGSLKGIDFILEVSEDAGASWSPTDVEFRTQREMFGIMLTGSEAANLASVNLDSLGSGAAPVVADSWWALLLQGKLFFRLTCSIEADHAARYDAKPSQNTSTGYDRVQLLTTDIVEYWSAPSGINALGSSDWSKLNYRGITTASGAYINQIKYDALLKQRSWEATPIAGVVQSWMLNFSKWRLLDSISMISGRNINLKTSPNDGGAEIAAMTFYLDERGQKMTMELEDQRYTDGA